MIAKKIQKMAAAIAATCFACSKPGKLAKCTHPQCDKLYHIACVKEFPRAKVGLLF